LKVLNELDSVINSCQSVVMLSIFSDPGIMLAVSGVLLSGIESLISLDVLDGLSEVRFSISQLSDGVVSQLGVSTLLGNVIVDVGVQISEDSLAGSQIGSVHGIMISLILDDSSHDAVQEDVHFVSRGFRL
jgi:hypothetical protein